MTSPPLDPPPPTFLPLVPCPHLQPCPTNLLHHLGGRCCRHPPFHKLEPEP
jgi:hypothetical protein